MRVAVIDPKGWLVGARETDKPGKGAIDAGDLPADGSYRWDGERFIPRGHGHGKPNKSQTGHLRATALLIRALTNGTPIPQECRDWADWYERNFG